MSDQLELDLMQKGLHDRVIAINDETKKLREELIHLQDICKHPAETLFRTACGSTGHYCQQDDSYWYKFECKCCGKRWNTDQDSKNRKTPCTEVKRC